MRVGIYIFLILCLIIGIFFLLFYMLIKLFFLRKDWYFYCKIKVKFVFNILILLFLKYINL